MNASELSAERTRLVQDKRAVETKLLKVKNLVRSSGWMPQEKYKACCESQSKYVEKIRHIENAISEVKLKQSELHHKSRPEFSEIEKADARVLKKSVIEGLVALRDEYQSFSADPTRVASMKQMAADFALRLSPLIKAALNKG